MSSMFEKSFWDFLFRTPEIGQIFIGQAIILAWLFYWSYRLTKYFMPTIATQIEVYKERKFLIIGLVLSIFLWISRAVIAWASYNIQSYLSNSISLSWGTSFWIIYFSIYLILLFMLLKQLISSIENDNLNSKFKFLGIFFAMLIIGTIIGIKLLNIIVA